MSRSHPTSIGRAREPLITVRVAGAEATDFRGFYSQVRAVLAKDLTAEIRSRTALNSILLFSVTALAVVGFSIGNMPVDPSIRGALLWVVLFFAAFSGLAHVFIHEEEAGTAQALRLTTPAGAVYAGKLLFNMIVVLGIAALIVPLFVLLLELRPRNPLGLAAVFIPGIVGLSSGATIVAAIIAKAGGKGALFGALGLPILLPLLVIAVDATSIALHQPAFTRKLGSDIIGMVSFSILTITASGLLFPAVWED